MFFSPFASAGTTFSFVDSTKTNKKGKWKIRAESALSGHVEAGTVFPLGDYFAAVKKKSKKKFTCKATESKTKEFGSSFAR